MNNGNIFLDGTTLMLRPLPDEHADVLHRLSESLRLGDGELTELGVDQTLLEALRRRGLASYTPINFTWQITLFGFTESNRIKCTGESSCVS